MCKLYAVALLQDTYTKITDINETYKIIMATIIIINCNWVVTRWQWLFYIYTKYEIGY